MLSDYGVLVSLLILCLFLSLLTPFFLTKENILNILTQSAITAILGVGLTLVIIAGGIDLSVGSVLAFTGVVLGSLLQNIMPIPAAVFFCLLLGALCGLVNGWLVAYQSVPPFIATLGMLSVARGLALLYTEGRSISGFSVSFTYLADGELLGIPLPIVIMITIFLLFHLILQKTTWGRYFYAIGGNAEAAWFAGINVRHYTTVTYILSGILAAAASVVLTARLNSAQPIAGIMYELDAIAAAVVGGVSLYGGHGTVAGTVLGAVIIGVIRNGLNLLDITPFFQQVLLGTIVILAVLADRRRVASFGSK